MSPPRVFISHATADHQPAKRVKRVLQEHGIGAFLAHEDVRVSEEWQSRLLRELCAADVLIALLSESYYSSLWAQQEIGFACARSDCLILPASIDGALPQGLISHLQKLDLDNHALSGPGLISPILARFPKRTASTLVAVLAEADDRDIIESITHALMTACPFLENAEVQSFAAALITNHAVAFNSAVVERRWVPELLARHGKRLSEYQGKQLQYLLTQPPMAETSMRPSNRHDDVTIASTATASDKLEWLRQHIRAGRWETAFRGLRDWLNNNHGHVEAQAMLRSAWCPQCRRPVSEPSANATSSYARFWSGRCPDCDRQLHLRL